MIYYIWSCNFKNCNDLLPYKHIIYARARAHTPCQNLIRKGFPLERLKCIFNENKKISCKDRFVNKNKINYIKTKTQAQLVPVSGVMSMLLSCILFLFLFGNHGCSSQLMRTSSNPPGS